MLVLFQGYNLSDYVPKGKLKLKKILLFFGKNGWGDLPLGRRKFVQDKCPVNSCFIEDNADLIEDADAVIFKDRFMWPKHGRNRMSQVWILFLLECPMHTQMFNSLDPHVFNWTATYRHDSDLVTPYEKFVPYESLLNESSKQLGVQLFESPDYRSLPVPVRIRSFVNLNRILMLICCYTKNYAEGKTRKVAWFVSNCGARNKRLEYARELSKHIDVDIYGR